MTRSKASTFSPKTMKKAYEQQARHAGVERRPARQYAFQSSAIPKEDISPQARRNPGRLDGVRWNSKSIVCPVRVEVVEDDVHYGLANEADVYDDWNDEPGAAYDGGYHADSDGRRFSERNAISLLDIAKPAKPRGIAKTFDIIDTLPRVIVLENDEVDSESDLDNEGWEDIYEETASSRPAIRAAAQPRKAYSEILRGG